MCIETFAGSVPSSATRALAGRLVFLQTQLWQPLRQQISPRTSALSSTGLIVLNFEIEKSGTHIQANACIPSNILTSSAPWHSLARHDLDCLQQAASIRS